MHDLVQISARTPPCLREHRPPDVHRPDPTGLITRVTDAAGDAPLAAGANVSASNVGNALGAWLGGLAITAGLGYTAPLYVGAAIVTLGLVTMMITARLPQSWPTP